MPSSLPPPRNLGPVDPSTESSRQAIRRFARRALTMVGVAYVGDGVLLAVYCAMGVTPWWVLGLLLGMAALQLTVFDYFFRSGLSQRFRDPALTLPQLVTGASVQVLFLALAPEAFVIFAFAAFTLVAFATLQMSFRRTLVAWGVLTLGVGLVIAFSGDRFKVPSGSTGERLVLLAAWSNALLRCVVIGSFGLAIRESVTRRQQQMQAAAQQFAELAHRDALTGAMNRRRILEITEALRTEAAAGGAGFSLALLDLDHFKRVNDEHGHLAGDGVLKAASNAIGASLRGVDHMGRYGGEEFLVLLTGVSTADGALRAAERVREGIASRPWHTIVPGLVQTASIGVAVCTGIESVEQLIARADAALYQCKREGRNTVRLG